MFGTSIKTIAVCAVGAIVLQAILKRTPLAKYL